MICPHPCKQVAQLFVWFAHLEFYYQQSQELRRLCAVVLNCLLDGFLECDEQVVGGKEAGAQASLDLESILPVHSLDPAMDLIEFALREESGRAGIHAGNSGRKGFTLRDVAYLLELGEIVRVSEENAQMMRVWSDAGMRGVNRRYTIACLEFAFALDALRSSTIVTFLLEVGRCMQIEYNDYCGSALSYARC